MPVMCCRFLKTNILKILNINNYTDSIKIHNLARCTYAEQVYRTLGDLKEETC